MSVPIKPQGIWRITAWVVGLFAGISIGLVFLPITFSVMLGWVTYKKVKNKNNRNIYIAGITLVGLMIGIPWVSAMFGDGSYEIEKEAALTPTPTLAQKTPVLTPTMDPDPVLVTRVIDANTFEVETGDIIRYIGVDSPLDTQGSCLNTESHQKNKEIVEGSRVRLEKDKVEVDEDGNQLRYVYKDNLLVNQLLVEEGFARTTSDESNARYKDVLMQSEKEAKENKWGIWSDLCVSPEPTQETVQTVDEPNEPRVAPAMTKAPTPTPVPQPLRDKVVATPQPVKEIVKPVPTKITLPKPALNCSSDSFNCGDFLTCTEVMAVFNACSGDPHRLDRNDDGVPCESLCE